MANNLEIGKLYVCPDYHLLVFPTEEKAVSAATGVNPIAVQAKYSAFSAAADWAAWWSKQLKCHVSWIPAGPVFCVVEMGADADGPVHVVAGESALGWIIVGEWMNIKEMKS